MKNLRHYISLLIMLAGLTLSGQALAQPVTISLPQDMNVEAGATDVAIPIMVEDDVTDLGVISFHFEFEYDATVAQYAGYDQTGTLTEDWVITVNPSRSDVVTINGFSTNPMSGHGTLIYLTFDIVGDPGMTSQLSFVTFRFNEGNPVVDVGAGSLIVAGADSYYDISGFVMYSDLGTPVPNTNVVMTGMPGEEPVVDMNGDDGGFMMANMPGGYHELYPQKDADERGAITVYDAALVAQFAADLITLSEYQQKAADVSDNAEITEYDAALIAQYTAGEINESITGLWTFSPEVRVYSPLEYDMLNQDFAAILYGDVSLNWGASAQSAGFGGLVDVSLPDEMVVSDAFIRVPIRTGDVSERGVIAFQTQLQYNSDMLEFLSVESGELTDGWSFVSKSENGQVFIGAYATAPMSGSGALVQVLFQLKGCNNVCDLSLEAFNFNEGAVPVSIQNGQVQATNPSQLFLAQNFPNPFAPTTTIAYAVSRESNVSIRVYNAIGQYVQTLRDEPHATGYYQVTWDGTNADGVRVSPGTYFYRLQSSEGDQTRRMVLMR